MKTIELIDLKIDSLVIDYELQCVKANYMMLDIDNTPWQKGEAIFWVTIPVLKDESGNPLPTPINWFLLPASYIPTLLQLQSDADAALTSVFLV